MPIPDRGVEVSNPQAYRSRIFGLLGDKDPLAVLGETPRILTDFTRSHSADTMRTRPFAGKWTPNEVIGHLTDTELTYGFRIRMILCEEKPTLLGMDQNLWVTGQRHNDRQPAELVEMFSALRRFNLILWKQMSTADFERVGMHNERGPESLGLILRMQAGHDLSHIDQIQRYIAAIQGQRE